MTQHKLSNLDPDNLPSNNKDGPNIINPAPVASGKIKSRKRSLSSEVRVIVNELFTNVIIPSTKGMLYEFLKDGIGQMIFGKTITNKYQRGLPSETYNTYNYNSQYSPNRPRAMRPYYSSGEIAFSPREDPLHTDIYYPSEVQARLVLAGMLDRLAQFNKVSLGDLRYLSNLEAGRVHQQYGWTNLTGTVVEPTPDGYILTLPDFQYTTLKR